MVIAVNRSVVETVDVVGVADGYTTPSFLFIPAVGVVRYLVIILVIILFTFDITCKHSVFPPGVFLTPK
jgi:hypothetical protein